MASRVAVHREGRLRWTGWSVGWIIIALRSQTHTHTPQEGVMTERDRQGLVQQVPGSSALWLEPPGW